MTSNHWHGIYWLDVYSLLYFVLTGCQVKAYGPHSNSPPPKTFTTLAAGTLFFTPLYNLIVHSTVFLRHLWTKALYIKLMFKLRS